MRSLVYAGKDFSEFKCWWDGSQIFRKPAKRIDKYSVPFRNGELFRSQYSFDNVQIVYNCFIKEDYQTNYSDLINYLNSFDKYQILQNSVEADTYRMAIFHAEVEPTTGQFLKDGKFTLTFDCMPQEFLTSGDTPVNVSNVYKRYTGKTVYIDNPTGQSEVTLFRADFSPKQDLNGYDNPWIGGGGKNLFPGVTPSTVTDDDVTYEFVDDNNGGNTWHIKASGTSSANNADSGNKIFGGANETPVTLKANTTYIASLTGVTSTSNIRLFLRSNTGTNLWYGDSTTGVWSVTPTEDIEVHRMMFRLTAAGSTIDIDGYFQIEEGSAKTDWTPYENICPITGWDTIPINTTATSRNLLPSDVLFPETVSGVTFTPNMDYPPTREHGIITADGTAEDDIHLMIYDGLQLPEGDYILTGCPAQTFYRYFLTLYKNGEIVGSQAGEGMRFVVHSGDSIGVGIGIFNRAELLNVEFKPMIRVGTDTNPTYEPYSEEPIPLFTIDLNGTRYGGHVEATTGVLTVDRASVIADPSLSWRYASGNGGYFYLSAAFPNLKRNGQVITNLLPTVTTLAEFASTENCVYCATNINIKVNGVNTVSDFQTWLTNNSLQVVYEIEPTTIQLTAQQIELATGMNQFGTDTDGLTVTVREPFTLVNPTLMESKPLIKIDQAGTYYLNGEQIIQTHGSGAVYPIYIDAETMDAYAFDQYGNRLNMNGYVDLPDVEIVLSSGENYFYSTASVTITPRWWRL